MTTVPLPLQYLPAVVVILRATTKQGKRWVNCQDMSQSAQGGDKSQQTCQTLQSVLKCMSFVQGPVEESCSGQERGVKEDKLDCYCVNCGVYIHTALSTVCHDPSHGGSYMAEGVFFIRIGLPPRVVPGDFLNLSLYGLI